MSAGPVIIQLNNGDRVDRFTVFKKLGEGTFGDVYGVRDESGAKHALKAELATEKIPLLKMELYVMQKLTAKKAKHMATLIDKGRHQNFNYIVMKFLGKSLEDAKKTGPDQHLTLGSAIGASIQCLEALEELHWCGFLHRNVKPGNFCLGQAECGELRKIFVIDFGLCRRFVDEQNVMLQPRKKAPYRGTPRYAPIASHNNQDQGRKDDVESWFYMLVDFTNAALPWKVVKDIKEVGDMKKNSRFDPLMSQMFTGCPLDEYREIMNHIDSLTFFMEPNYGLIYATLRGLMRSKRILEFPYDWEAADGRKFVWPKSTHVQLSKSRLKDLSPSAKADLMLTKNHFISWIKILREDPDVEASYGFLSYVHHKRKKKVKQNAEQVETMLQTNDTVVCPFSEERHMFVAFVTKDKMLVYNNSWSAPTPRRAVLLHSALQKGKTNRELLDIRTPRQVHNNKCVDYCCLFLANYLYGHRMTQIEAHVEIPLFRENFLKLLMADTA